MGKILKNIIIVSVFMSILFSCSSDGCLDNQSSIPLAGFYSSATNEAVSLDSINIYGIGATGDSLLSVIGTSTQQVYLPFRSTQDSTSFCVHYGYTEVSSPEMNDTILFKYNSTIYFASEECGAMYKYDITSVQYTRHIIDTIIISNPEINNIDIERIKIYFQPN